MTFDQTIRYVILALSMALMVLGILIIAGFMVPVYFPGDYRMIVGTVIFLYGVYRFAVAYWRRPKEER